MDMGFDIEAGKLPADRQLVDRGEEDRARHTEVDMLVVFVEAAAQAFARPEEL